VASLPGVDLGLVIGEVIEVIEGALVSHLPTVEISLDGNEETEAESPGNNRVPHRYRW
jgi:hypothetical protein